MMVVSIRQTLNTKKFHLCGRAYSLLYSLSFLTEPPEQRQSLRAFFTHAASVAVIFHQIRNIKKPTYKYRWVFLYLKPDDDLLSHGNSQTTIGDTSFHV